MIIVPRRERYISPYELARRWRDVKIYGITSAEDLINYYVSEDGLFLRKYRIYAKTIEQGQLIHIMRHCSYDLVRGNHIYDAIDWTIAPDKEDKYIPYTAQPDPTFWKNPNNIFFLMEEVELAEFDFGGIPKPEQVVLSNEAIIEDPTPQTVIGKMTTMKNKDEVRYIEEGQIVMHNDLDVAAIAKIKQRERQAERDRILAILPGIPKKVFLDLEKGKSRHDIAAELFSAGHSKSTIGTLLHETGKMKVKDESGKNNYLNYASGLLK